MEPERLIRITENRIRQFGREQKLWSRGDRVVLAVSGGADSLCMLHVMARIARLDALDLIAAHLNHGMRGAAADDDEAFVKSQADTLGVSFLADRVDVPALAHTSRMGLEEAGRRARQQFLDRVIADTGAMVAATAHTRSDHVETVLLHLFRGSGLQGLTGIRPHGDGQRIRPLLCLSREETEAFCQALGLQPRSDPGNLDLSFQRNRLRHVVLPLLRESMNPSVDAAIERCSAVAASALELVEAAGRVVYESAVGRQPGTLRRHPLQAAAPAAAAEAVRLALGSAHGGPEGIHFSDVERVLKLVRTGGQAALSNGGFAEASGEDLRIRYPVQPAAGGNTGGTPAALAAAPPGESTSGPANAPETMPVRVAIPGVTSLPGGSLVVTLSAGAPNEAVPPPPDRVCLYVRPPVWARFPLPGDRLRPAWRGGTRKLKDLFVEFRIPAWDRSTWPVILDGGGIVWAPVLGVAEHAASPAEGSEAITIEWRRETPS